jgi:protein-L-isoaspartate(D-aspartate) O-methyltransferase
MRSVEEHRKFFAEYVVRMGGCDDPRLIAAFANVPREAFLGPGPWRVAAGSTYIATPDDDPRWVYQDCVIGLAKGLWLNNGQPSLHARCICAALPAAGETVVHIGVGSGYYTALLAELVGPEGCVIGLDIERELVQWAQTNLRRYRNVDVRCASAADANLDQADVIYVNAGATHPPSSWIEAMKPGGRLVFPLTGTGGAGLMLLVRQASTASLPATALCRVTFTPCIGVRDHEDAARLRTTIDRESFRQIRSLRRGVHPDASSWYVGEGWWLSTNAPSADPPGLLT